MPEPTRMLPVPEAMLMRFYNAQHRFLNCFSAAQTLTPNTGKRIVVTAARLQTDLTNGTVAISCTGVDTSTFRAGALFPEYSGPDGIFAGATDQGITFTKGGTLGSYHEVWLTYIEL